MIESRNEQNPRRGPSMWVNTLDVQLMPQDLMLLFNFALAHNLLTVTTPDR
jgi:hypothetical protein